jgi:predicted transcriptional regulator
MKTLRLGQYLALQAIRLSDVADAHTVASQLGTTVKAAKRIVGELEATGLIMKLEGRYRVTYQGLDRGWDFIVTLSDALWRRMARRKPK